MEDMAFKRSSGGMRPTQGMDKGMKLEIPNNFSTFAKSGALPLHIMTKESDLYSSFAFSKYMVREFIS